MRRSRSRRRGTRASNTASATPVPRFARRGGPTAPGTAFLADRARRPAARRTPPCCPPRHTAALSRTPRNSAHEVVRAHRRAAICLGPLRRLLQQPVHVFVQGGERVSGGIAARLLEHALRLACDDEGLQRLLGHLRSPVRKVVERLPKFLPQWPESGNFSPQSDRFDETSDDPTGGTRASLVLPPARDGS